MIIYVDADACPQAVKQILYKAAVRTQQMLILVANQSLHVPSDPLIKTVRVANGADVADDYIAEQVQANDLVITADIPLADRVIDRHATALNPRGELYTRENIKQALSLRNFFHDLRSAGVNTSGAKPMSPQDIRKFANALDKQLTVR